MVSLEVLKSFVLVSIILSAITCTFIQKTKVLFNNKKYLIVYSFIVNLIFGVVFCNTFSNITFPHSLWIGVFSFLGADTIYRSLEGKLSTYQELREKKFHRNSGKIGY